MKRHTIIIFSSNGGGGHSAASAALKHYLYNDYDVEIINIFHELLPSLDIFRYLTGYHYSGEELYNLLIQKKYFRLLSYFSIFGSWYIQLQKHRINTILHRYCATKSPNLIISVIPYINDIILTVAQELDVPFLIIPTDLDSKTYCKNIYRPAYKKLYIGLAFNDQKIINQVKKSILQENIFIIGPVVKINFLENNNKDQLNKQHNSTPSPFTIMILMGAQGCNTILDYLRLLLQISYPLHIIVCIGNNTMLKHAIEALSLPPTISLEIVGFTDKIAEYMAKSDILISKSGTLSVWESLCMNLPLILDATSFILPWERFNHTFVHTHTFGTSVHHYEDIIPLIQEMIEKPSLLQRYRNNIALFEKKNCYKEVKELVRKIIR